MKTVTKVGLKSVSMISSVRGLEESLAKRDLEIIERSIPEDSPLQAEMERQKSIIGDLSGLPPGHPLLIAMQKAKEDYERQQKLAEANTSKTAANKTKELQKARDAKRLAERREADEDLERVNNCIGEYNKQLDCVLDDIRKMFALTESCEKSLISDPLCRVKTLKAKRLLYASEKGLSECRMVKRI